MKKYHPVDIDAHIDEFGQEIPDMIIWNDCEFYPVERIIHVCQPEDHIVRYTIRVDGRQRCLYFNGSQWRISNPL